VPCDLNLEELAFKLKTLDPLTAFNLVESLDGHGRLIHVVPFLLDALGIPYTGCPAEAICATSHKVMAKERMRAAGLPTPDWINPVPLEIPWAGAGKHGNEKNNAGKERVWIIKSLWEHASIGLELENLVTGSEKKITGLLASRARDLGGACFAEAFIDGREFNLSLLGPADAVRVLPPAEIVFNGFEADMPKIVGYRAKWMPDSAEYHHTPRCFDFPGSDRDLLSTLETLARRCWQIFGLKGYARVDFRVDKTGNPFILEINANPCISPDAGFAAALERAEIDYFKAVQIILAHQAQPVTLNKR
jgi:D-alanine-D-alanine ligase